MMLAILEMIGMFGTLLGGLFLAELVQHLGWRVCVLGAGGIAAALAVLLWMIVRDAPTNVVSIRSRPKGSVWGDLKALTKNKIAWINGVYSGLMFSVVTVFVALWGIPFLEVEHHLSLTMSVLVSNLIFVGIAIGSPVIGWLDSRFDQRRAILVGGALISAVLLSVLIYIPALPMFLVVSLMLLLGFVCSTYILNFVVANEIATPHTRSAGIGFINTLCVGVAPIMQPLIGFLLLLFSNHVLGSGATDYSVDEYQGALTVMPLVLLLAAWLAKYIPGKKPIEDSVVDLVAPAHNSL